MASPSGCQVASAGADDSPVRSSRFCRPRATHDSHRKTAWESPFSAIRARWSPMLRLRRRLGHDRAWRCHATAQPESRQHHPVLVAHQAQRAADLQLRIADGITTFAGWMPFVYIHVALFVVRSTPPPTASSCGTARSCPGSAARRPARTPRPRTDAQPPHRTEIFHEPHPDTVRLPAGAPSSKRFEEGANRQPPPGSPGTLESPDGGGAARRAW